MKIKFLVFGKLKEQAYSNLVNFFLKQLNYFVETEIIELKDLPDPKIINNTNLEKNLANEGIQIDKYLTQKNYLIVCDSHGQQFDSIEYANHLQKIINSSQFQNIVILIGSSNGIHNSIKQKANLILSFSKMTFPHNLMRIILLEQTYRAFTIIHHRHYHK